MRVIELTILMIIGGLVEMGAVALMFPFTDAAINVETIMEKPYAAWFCAHFEIDSPKSFLIVTAVALAAAYIFKNAYLLWEYNIQYRFVYGNMFAMQKKLLDYLMHRPYEYFLKVNSGEALCLVNEDVTAVFNLLLTLLFLFIEVIVSVMLSIMVFMMMPMITAAILAVLLSLLIFIHRVIKPVLRRAGMDKRDAGIGMNKWLIQLIQSIQSIQGIKELKVMRAEVFFKKITINMA